MLKTINCYQVQRVLFLVGAAMKNQAERYPSYI